MLRQPSPLYSLDQPRALKLHSSKPHIRRLMAMCLVFSRDPTIAQFCMSTILIDSHEWVNGPMAEENAGVKLFCVLIHTFNNIVSETLEPSLLAQFERLARLVSAPTLVGLYDFFYKQLQIVMEVQAPNLYVVADWLTTRFTVKQQILCKCKKDKVEVIKEPRVIEPTDANVPFDTYFTCCSGVRESDYCKKCHQQKVEINKPMTIPLTLYLPMNRCSLTYELDAAVSLGAVYGSVDTAEYELNAIASEQSVWLRKNVDTWLKFNLHTGQVDEVAQDNTPRTETHCELMMLGRIDGS
jgi:hypothetical protein